MAVAMEGTVMIAITTMTTTITGSRITDKGRGTGIIISIIEMGGARRLQQRPKAMAKVKVTIVIETAMGCR
jgi:hypothetical protein